MSKYLIIILAFFLGGVLSFLFFSKEKTVLVKIENNFYPINLQEIKNIEFKKDYSIRLNYKKSVVEIKNSDKIRQLAFDYSKGFFNIESIDPIEKVISSKVVMVYLKASVKIQNLSDISVFSKDTSDKIKGDYKIFKDGFSVGFCPKIPYSDGDYKVLIEKICFKDNQCVNDLKFEFRVSDSAQSNPFEGKCEF